MYRDKYYKYKAKYLDLKNSMTIGGGERNVIAGGGVIKKKKL